MARKDGYYGPSDSDMTVGAVMVAAAVFASVAVIGYCVGAELYAMMGGIL